MLGLMLLLWVTVGVAVVAGATVVVYIAVVVWVTADFVACTLRASADPILVFLHTLSAAFGAAAVVGCAAATVAAVGHVVGVHADSTEGRWRGKVLLAALLIAVDVALGESLGLAFGAILGGIFLNWVTTGDKSSAVVRSVPTLESLVSGTHVLCPFVKNMQKIICP